jgi:hypothetical protein
MVGELGFLAPDNRRTQTVECVEDGEVLTITYDKLLELCFQNPHFGYYFLRLSSGACSKKCAPRRDHRAGQGQGGNSGRVMCAASDFVRFLT